MAKRVGKKGGGGRDWAALVREFDSGTETRASFAARQGISVATLDYHRRRLRSGQTRFVEVDWQAPQTTAAGRVLIVLSNGRRIEFDVAVMAANEARLAALARSLDSE